MTAAGYWAAIFSATSLLQPCARGRICQLHQLAPRVRTKSGAAEIAFANTNPFGPGGASNPLNFPVERLTVGNGLGFNTLEPALGFPAGGLGPDNRIGLYVETPGRLSTTLR